MGKIPKIIWTIWLSEDEKYPPLVAKCLPTHSILGYEHRIITLENCFRGTRYIQECLEAKRWAKAADYLRVFYLRETGGIYLDADVEVVGSFEPFLQDKMFVGREENNFVSNAIIGSEPGHPILEEYLGKVDRNFIGSGDLVYQPGMYLWTELTHCMPGVTIYPPEVFLPYNWQSNKMNRTDKTVTIHYFNRSWL